MANQDVIQSYYQSFNQKDYQKMLSFLSDDINHEINEGEAVQGKEAFEKFLAKMDHHYEEQVKELVVFSGNQANRMAAEFKIDGIYKNTDAGLPAAHGQSYCISVGAFFELEDGLITRITNYYNLNNWIKAVQ